MIGQQLGSFQIDEKIGAGAMGVVYRATHVKTKRPAAVKVVTAEQVGKGNAADRFEREAEILQQFRHPNIVRFLAVGRSKGIRYFAMEFIEGLTLEQILEERGFLPWQDALDLGIQLGEALQYAHERGVVHRDLKPSNIMLTLDARVKLTDFGIAKDLDATALTATGRTLGTAAYMAPEQIRGTPEVSHKTDLYALGCLLYQTLVGQPPFKGSQIAVLMNCHLNEPPPRPSTKNPEVPRALDDLVLNLMAKSPSDRPWDAQAVLQSLTELRDKIARGETIKMVFGAAAIAPRAPTGATLDTAAAASPVPTSTKARKSSKGKKKRSKGGGWQAPSLTTIGLAGAFLLLVGLVIYMLLPPSAEQLYAKARPLMESTSNEDWDAAERRYLSELDRRFPDHPHAAEVAKFRDKVSLDRAERRGRILQSAVVAQSNDQVESLYIGTAAVSTDAIKLGREDKARDQWLELAKLVESAHPEKRGWMLLARKNAAELDKVMGRRKQEVENLLADAAAAEAEEDVELAQTIRRTIRDRYGRYRYLSDLVNSAVMRLPEGAGTSETPDAGEMPPTDATGPEPPASDTTSPPPSSKPADSQPAEPPGQPEKMPAEPGDESPMNLGETRVKGDSAN